MSIMSKRAEKAQLSNPQYATNTIGAIRPGTKLVVNAVKENSTAMAIANRAFSGEISYIEAEKLISKAVPSIKKAFFPRNTTYFNIHPSDFAGGAQAVARLLELYGEKRPGDAEAKLYRFPVVFPDAGSADAAIPVRFEMHTGLKYHSQENLDGTSSCVFIKPVLPADVLAQRAMRIKQVPRRELTIRGACVPEKCAEFANGDCKLKGSLIFYVPGLPGGAVKMPTGSSYALEKIWSEIHTLHKTIGRIPNFDNHGKPVFWMTKSLEDRVYFDDKGEKKNGQQWVPFLDSKIDKAAIMLIQDQQRGLLSAPSTGQVSAPVVSVGPAAWQAQAPLGVAAADVPLERVQEREYQRQDDAMKRFMADENPVESKVSTAASNKIDVGTGEIVDAPVKVAAQPAAKPVLAASVATPVDQNLSALDKVLGLGADWQEEVEQYALSKYGNDWDIESKAKLVLDDLQEMFSKLTVVECRGPMLLAMGLLYQYQCSDEDIKNIVKPYWTSMFGNKYARDPVQSKAVRAKTAELFESGTNVALSYMKRELAKAA